MKLDIQVEVYATKFGLKSAFVTASGRLTHKTELIVAARRVSIKELIYAMEMPLSPSSGESIENVIFSVENASSLGSLSVRRFMSYLEALCTNNGSVPFPYCVNDPPDNSLDLLTFDIGSVPLIPCGFEGIIKLKGSPNNVSDIICFIKQTSCRFIVDFNGSLSISQFQDFIQCVEIEKVFGVEHPTPNFGEGLNCNVYQIADGYLSMFGYDEIVSVGYKGFVFKPFLNEFNTLYKCIENSANLWGIVGSNVSGPIDASLVGLINNLMPVRLCRPQTSFYADHPLDDVSEPLHIMTDTGLLMSSHVDLYLKKKANLRAIEVI